MTAYADVTVGKAAVGVFPTCATRLLVQNVGVPQPMQMFSLANPADSLPTSHAAYVFYVKLELAQHRIRVDDACLSLRPMCRLARGKRLTPRECAHCILECIDVDALDELSDAKACSAIATALHELRSAD